MQSTASIKIYVALALAGLNLAIGGIVALFRLPIYLDTLGIVVCTILLGFRFGLLTALVTVVLGFFVINPYFPFYILTALGIVTATSLLTRARMFNSLLRSAFSGLIIALVAAVLSAPVTTYLGGNTMSGVDAVTAFLAGTGRSLLDSVLITGLTSEPVDKIIVCTLAYLAVRRLPKTTLERAGLRSLPISS